MPVTIENFDRGTAEQKYGFRIYQGGVVPVNQLELYQLRILILKLVVELMLKKQKRLI